MREGWVVFKFKDVASAVKGKLPKNKNEVGIGIPYLTASYLRTSKPDFWIENLEGAVTAEHGDCLILWDGAGAGDLFSAHRGVVSSTMAVVTTQNSRILREFLTLFISSKAEYIKETCRGTTVPHVSPDAIANMDLKIPPLPEQKRIVDLISSVDSYIEALQQHLESAQKSRNAVLHELLTAGGGDWVEEILGEISEVTMGRQLSPSKKLGLRPRPYIRAANIGSWGINLEDIFEMDFTEIEESKFSSKIGDTLLVEGGNEKSVGCPALVTKREEGLCIQNTVIRCRTKDPAKFDPNFQYHLLRFMFWRGDFAELCAGTTIMHLGQKRAEVIRVQLPPKAKQIEIVEIISTMDEVVNKTELILTNTQNLRSGLLSDLLSGEHEIPASYDKVMGVA
jgi:type I restriction enzyme S subunit